MKNGKSYRLYLSDIHKLKVKANSTRGAGKELLRMCKVYEKHRLYFESVFGIFSDRVDRPPKKFNYKRNVTRPTSFYIEELLAWLENMVTDEQIIMDNHQSLSLLIHFIIRSVDHFDNNQEEVYEWYQDNHPEVRL